VRPTLALALACAAALGCSREPGPNLLLLVSDTLRADALACYGGSARTPNLCRLAEQGALFERAYAAAPWTAPSTVALFTGSHATGFGDLPSGARGQTYYMGDEERVLADALREKGYAARFDLDNGLAYYSNAFQGLEVLDNDAPGALAAVPPGFEDDERSARMGATIDYLAHAAEPFFAVRWILDPHAPYGPPPARLAALAPLAEGLPHPIGFYAGLGHHNAENRLRKVAPTLGEPERRLLRALYDEEVAWVDERVGWLFAQLDRRGLWPRTLVVFTSDHGEAFGEHGLWLHGKSLHEGLLRVPLLIAGPGVPAGRRVGTPVSLTDLTPTLCAWLAADCGQGAQGTSFAALLAGRPDDAAERAAYAGAPNDPAHGIDALIAGDWKLVAHADGSAALFDLARDPGELHDVAAAHPEQAARLRRRLDTIRAENEALRVRRLAGRSERQMQKLRDDTRRGLEALGYVE
jgi:arylsulfatase A-like enzyme